MGHVKGNMKHYEEIMIALDKDCNGMIDYSEFLTAAVDKNKLLSQKNLKLAFQMIDTDASGSLTVEELKSVFEMHGKKDDALWV